MTINRPIVRLAAALSLGVAAHAGLGQEAPAPDAAPGAIPAADNIDERAFENLLAWARLMPHVMHFHPSSRAASTDLDFVLRDGFAKVAPARNAEELAAAMLEILAPFAPTVQVFPQGEEHPAPDFMGDAPPNDVAAVTIWLHRGYSERSDSSGMFESVRYSLNPVSRDATNLLADPELWFEADLAGGVHARIPAALWASVNSGTLPDPNPMPSNSAELRDETWEYSEPAERLAAAAEAWALLRSFHPMVQYVEMDWEAAQAALLRRALAAQGEAELLDAIRETLLVPLGDARGAVVGHAGKRATLPVRTLRVRDRLFIQHGGDSAQPGEEIVSINGEPVSDLLAALLATTPGRNEDVRLTLAAERALLGAPGSEATLTLRDPDGNEREVSLTFGATIAAPPPVRELDDGVMFVDFGAATMRDFLQALDDLASADAIVWDLRSSEPSLTLQALGLLSETELPSPERWVHVVLRPEASALHYIGRGTTLLPREPRLTARSIFLIDEASAEWSEQGATIIDAFDLGTLVGRTTMGAAGEPTAARLPGGAWMRWTGLEVRTHKGAQVFGRGITPEVVVEQTVEQAQRGEDAILARALELALEPAREAPPAQPAQADLDDDAVGPR